MAVTIQMIAEAAGVSRGTVDRALNNRGRINPEVANRVKKIAKEMGYQPNIAGKALAMAKKGIKIGIIIQSSDTPFMKEVVKGVKSAKEEIGQLGVEAIIYEIENFNAIQVIRQMEIMKETGVNAIALVPTEDELVKETINRFVTEYHIPIVTLNADAQETNRLCFIGQDALQSGRTAASLMGEIVGGSGIVSVISGHSSNPSLNRRCKGFIEEMKQYYPGVELLEVRYSYDDAWVSRKILEEQLQQYPNIKGVYIASHGGSGVCELIEEYKLTGKLKVIAHDYTGGNKENLEKGIIQFILLQNAYVQGYESVMVLFRLLFHGTRPERECWYTEIVIKTRNNI